MNTPAPNPENRDSPPPDPQTPSGLLRDFERCAIPIEQWTHRTHLTVAYLILLEDQDLGLATDRMRAGIVRYNAAKGIRQTATTGYHETLTVAWMWILNAAMSAEFGRQYGSQGSGAAELRGPGATSPPPESFFHANPHLLSPLLLKLYYSSDRMMSVEARRSFVEPDLGPLPTVTSREGSQASRRGSAQ